MRVMLITACGCRRTLEVPRESAGRNLFVPIVRSRWGAQVSGKVDPVFKREFEYDGETDELVIYREVLR